ncbi:MAG: sigma-54-dependent Fis family transcriptional regulator [Planctomycetes bacterium]|nr:sigma-54-dependent Fis family transcriptional regulator [Planctomycetota bacterium]
MYDPANVDLLIVDDDDDFRATIVRRFERRGFNICEAATGEEALGLIEQRQFDVGIFDMVMPGLSGLELLEKLKAEGSEMEIIMLTGQGTIESAVQAMKLGAYDYLTKPFPLAELELLIQKAYERRQLGKENRQLRALLERSQPKWNLIGESPAMREVYRLIERAGPSDKAILICGESGTGKELVARALHKNSPRAHKPLVAINCTALSESLLESELFGHEKGAFTGASAAKPGLFEIADGGTLFIDEIGDMPGVMQAKLLRVLEDGSFRRVGSHQERRVNVRVISATHRDLAEEVRQGRFRDDLYYRINVMSIDLPPLRERTGDLPLLISHFLGPDWKIEKDALEAMERYHWPGNIRQLINVIERAKILADGHVITRDDLPPEITKPSANLPAVDMNGTLAALERARIVEALEQARGNKTRAAQALGITRRSLYRLLDKYNIRTEPAESRYPPA